MAGAGFNSMGGIFMSTITGTSGSDVLSGTRFNDFIDGAGGIDTINAGAGDDIVRIATFPAERTLPLSMIDGGADHDILDLVDLPGTARVNILGDGTILAGTVNMVDGIAVFTPVAQAAGFEEIHLGAGGSNVSIDLGAVNQPTPFQGWKIVGNSATDFIDDGRGTDTIDAGAGADKVSFHGGNDIVELRDGNDFYTVSGLAGFSGQAQVDGGGDTDSLIWEADSIFGTISVDLAAGRGQSGTAITLLSDFENVFVGGFAIERLRLDPRLACRSGGRRRRQRPPRQYSR
jgi:Ca2+-binding RTX toxin-like protein